MQPKNTPSLLDLRKSLLDRWCFAEGSAILAQEAFTEHSGKDRLTPFTDFMQVISPQMSSDSIKTLVVHARFGALEQLFELEEKPDPAVEITNLMRQVLSLHLLIVRRICKTRAPGTRHGECLS